MPSVIGVAILFFGAVLVLWMARLMAIAVELQSAVNAVATNVAETGCWTQQTTATWQRAIATFPLSTTSPTVQAPLSAQSYAPYGQAVTITARTAVAPFNWSQTRASTASLVMTAGRTVVSTAPMIGSAGFAMPGCEAPPGGSG